MRVHIRPWLRHPTAGDHRAAGQRQNKCFPLTEDIHFPFRPSRIGRYQHNGSIWILKRHIGNMPFIQIRAVNAQCIALDKLHKLTVNVIITAILDRPVIFQFEIVRAHV